jgi:hypothetical protein
MAVGLPLKTTYADGDVYSASDVNDTNGTVNLVGQTNNFYAGKNKIINGDFGVWQRGTSFAMAGSGIYTADRWNVAYSGATGATVSQYVMTPGELNSFTFGYSLPGTLTDAVNGFILFRQPIENVRTLANQTATVSFWAKGSATGTIGIRLLQAFGTGGSPSADLGLTPQTQAITTTWTRYSLTFSIPSITSKTLGTNPDSKLFVNFDKNIGTGNSIGYGTNPNFTGTLSITGIQIEQGSTATAFQTATGTIQGELAACQRYYYRWVTGGNSTAWIQNVFNYSTTIALGAIHLPVSMRVNPTSIDVTATASNYRLLTGDTVSTCSAVPVLDTSNFATPLIKYTVASGLTLGRGGVAGANTTNDAFIGFNAEL